MSFSPQRRAIFRHQNFKKCSQTLSFFEHFDVRRCFLPQRHAIFRHQNFKKCSQTLSFFTCSLPNALLATVACNFFDIRTSKSAPRPPVFLAFSLPNALLATAACNFSTSELQKVLPDPQFFSIFTSKCASLHSSVQFLISPLTTWLRTRRFNRPTFRLIRHTNHWKNTDASSFFWLSRYCIFFLLYSAFQLSILSEVCYLNFLR